MRFIASLVLFLAVAATSFVAVSDVLDDLMVTGAADADTGRLAAFSIPALSATRMAGSTASKAGRQGYAAARVWNGSRDAFVAPVRRQRPVEVAEVLDVEPVPQVQPPAAKPNVAKPSRPSRPAARAVAQSAAPAAPARKPRSRFAKRELDRAFRSALGGPMPPRQ
ncbi:MAG: hypothetical protein ACK5JT_04380 [Hyphomicrobiaceae bacterium]